MTFTTITKVTDQIVFGKFNATALNRQVRIRVWRKDANGNYTKRQTITARQLFEMLGEEKSADVLNRFDRHMADGHFSRCFRVWGKVQLEWR